jgi:hypothetical protein
MSSYTGRGHVPEAAVQVDAELRVAPLHELDVRERVLRVGRAADPDLVTPCGSPGAEHVPVLVLRQVHNHQFVVVRVEGRVDVGEGVVAHRPVGFRKTDEGQEAGNGRGVGKGG